MKTESVQTLMTKSRKKGRQIVRARGQNHNWAKRLMQKIEKKRGERT